MKKIINNDGRSLEGYRVFPIIAWVLTISFASFVYNISLRLNEVTEDLETQSEWVRNQQENYMNNKFDFDNYNKKPTKNIQEVDDV